MSSAALFKRGSRFIVHPTSATIYGVGIATPPFIILSVDIAPAALGEAILRALDAARSGLPHPSDWSSVTKEFCHAVGVKSWSTFAKGALHCIINRDEQRFTFTSSRKPRTGDAFEFLEPATSLPLDSSAEKIGLAAEEALRVSAAASHD